MNAPPRWTRAEADQSIARRFEGQAECHARRLALTGEREALTYAELNARANQLAHALRERPAERGVRVAVLLPHGSAVVAAALAVLKAGLSVVVLNPRDPPAHLAKVWCDAEPALLLCDREHREAALRAAVPGMSIVDPETAATGRPTSNLCLECQPAQTAFLVYTSGSSGRPKGVMQTHRQILLNVRRFTQRLDYTAEDRFALLGGLYWGQGVATACTALLNGAALCPFDISARGFTGLPAWLRATRVTVFISSPSVFRQFARSLAPPEFFPEIRYLRLGAEAASHGDFEGFRRHFARECGFVSAYSASETGSIALAVLREAPVGNCLPVGPPLEGVQLLLRDEHGRASSPGEPGEIFVRSEGLAGGYWRNEALTRERFPVEQGTRLFRTGDLGRLLEDGSLVLHGRRDSQVKIRGHRVELSEVEAILCRHPDVSEAVVQAEPGPQDIPRMLAHIVRHPASGLEPEAFRSSLSALLPPHLKPSQIHFHDALPRTANGKLDRGRLAALAPRPTAPANSDGSTEMAELIGAAWSQELGVAGASHEADFFALGGDSLGAAAMAARLSALFRVEITLRLFAQHASISGLAALIEQMRRRGGGAAMPSPVRLPPETPRPLSFAQARCVRSSARPREANVWIMTGRVRITGPLQVEAFRRSVERIVRRHEILRSTMRSDGATMLQVAHAGMRIELPLTELRAGADPASEARRKLREMMQAPFSFESGPLLRLHLLRAHESEHWLLRVNHHLISDAFSWSVFYHELALLYEAELRGEAPPLPEEMEWQFGDYAAWERTVLGRDGRVFAESLARWRQQLAAPAPPFVLPALRRTRRPQALPAEGVLAWGIEPALSAALSALATGEKVTSFMIRLAGFAALLALETNAADLVVGTYCNLRQRPEWQNLFGCLANPIALRFNFSGERSFRQWLPEVRGIVLEAQEHAHIPFEELCEELRASGVQPPRLRVVFAISDERPRHFGGLMLERQPGMMAAMPVCFTVVMNRTQEDRLCHASFDATVCDPQAVRSLLNRFGRFLHALKESPDAPMGVLHRQIAGRESLRARARRWLRQIFPACATNVTAAECIGLAAMMPSLYPHALL